MMINAYEQWRNAIMGQESDKVVVMDEEVIADVAIVAEPAKEIENVVVVDEPVVTAEPEPKLAVLPPASLQDVLQKKAKRGKKNARKKL
jgi:hypothetical protein